MFWIYQGSDYFRVAQGSEYGWIFLIMSDWKSLDLSEYATICGNLPKSAWTAFVLYLFPHSSALYTWTLGYLFQRLHTTRSFSLKQSEAVFLETQFNLTAVSILFGFCFRLNISTSKFSNLLLPLWVEGDGVCESWSTLFSLLYL